MWPFPCWFPVVVLHAGAFKRSEALDGDDVILSVGQTKVVVSRQSLRIRIYESLGVNVVVLVVRSLVAPVGGLGRGTHAQLSAAPPAHTKLAGEDRMLHDGILDASAGAAGVPSMAEIGSMIRAEVKDALAEFGLMISDEKVQEDMQICMYKLPVSAAVGPVDS